VTTPGLQHVGQEKTQAKMQGVEEKMKVEASKWAYFE